MKTSGVWIGGALLALSALPLRADLSPAQLKRLPAPAPQAVDFSREIKPILQSHCIQCHGHGRKHGGFSMETRDSFLKGGDSGPELTVGKSAESRLIHYVSGLDSDDVMPKKGTKLNAAEVGLLRAWIDQGLDWEKGFAFARPPAFLAPRMPPIPEARAGLALANPIDRFVDRYFQAHHFNWKEPVSDRLYARRVYLDAVGLAPTPAQLERFERSSSPDKRERLVDEALAESGDYAIHWLSFWNDLLRNDYKGTGYIDGGRKQITPWLYASLASNKPFDRFVSELINPTDASAGFTKGIVWRGVVNASQRPEMQAAQNISQVFMGVNLKCASCHDSFINDWQLSDSYGLASIYADGPMQIYRCDHPTGKTAEMKFLYPELGTIDPKAPKAERLKALARIITQKKNGRLARTIVNRLWQRLFGAGLVATVDDMDKPAWSPDLLDFLGADLEDHGYDLKRTLRLMLTSRAYQLPAVPALPPTEKAGAFEGPLVRRLSAEQYVDLLSEITGVWAALPANTRIDFRQGRSEKSPAQFEPKWIWNTPAALYHAASGKLYFRKIVTLVEIPEQAVIIASADDKFTLYVNGHQALKGSEWSKPQIADVRDWLVRGENLIAVAAENGPAANLRTRNPAGLIVYGWLRSSRERSAWDFVSDGSWRCGDDAPEHWEKSAELDPGSHWNPAAELGPASAGSWNLRDPLARLYAAAELDRRSRAALEPSDPLMTALGRPNRETVVTVRSSVATTLEAMELTNGQTLATALSKGAAHLLQSWKGAPGDLAARIFETGLARAPSPVELAEAESLLGQPIQKDGLEDLLWSVSVLPEFQLIY